MNKPRLKRLEIKKKKRLTEAGKNLLIVVLIISSLLMLREIGIIHGVANSAFFDGIRGEKSDSEAIGTYTAAAEPFCIVVTPEAGAHCAVMYDKEAVLSTYDLFSAKLAEALGSADKPETVTTKEWEDALSGCGIYFDFQNAQSLSVLAGWLGTNMSGDAATQTARRICLSVDESGVALYYICAGDGEIYRCKTALQYTTLNNKMAQSMPDGSSFNFELATPFDRVDSYAVIRHEQLAIMSVTAGNPMTDDAQHSGLMALFGMNSILAYSYSESDGAVTYVEGDDALRVGADGTIVFTRTNSPENTALLPLAQAIEIARDICGNTIGADCGEATVFLSYIGRVSGTDSYSIRFDYAVNGLPVRFLDGSSAAELTLTGGQITSAKMIFRKYYSSGSTEEPVTSLQAAAIVQASGGGEPVLSYVDDNSLVTVDWVINQHG